MKLQSKILLSIARWLPRGYWRIASLAAKNDQALWDIRLPIKAVANAEIRADLRESVYMPIFKHGCFTHQVGENRLCMALIKPGDIVYDVGANIGYTTLLFSHAVGATGTVIAFEPAPRIFRLLTRSLASMENVECLNLAVSSTEGEASFYEAKSLDTSSLQAIADVVPYNVPITTLDAFSMSAEKPSFVKIDVEDHEQWVFRGTGGLLSSAAPPIVIFESIVRREAA